MTIGSARKRRAQLKMRETLDKVRRGLRKPPRYILERLAADAREQAEKILGPRRARRFGLNALLDATGQLSVDQLWSDLQSRSYPAVTGPLPPSEYERICPGDLERITRSAEDALMHLVDLLGSGLVELGLEIDWHKDYKTGLSWPLDYAKDIDYCNPERPSDVKFPWEVSRMQWLIPAGQAYLLTGKEAYAQTVRGVIEQWIAANPYGYGVNWASTIEVALRILTWTWFFHVFSRSKAWNDSSFREQFLRCLYLHGVFTERHLEKSDINGNHYTANAAGLVFAGLFFGECASARRWADHGWAILVDELPRQVYSDGVDFEASIAYHRLVFELFLLPALYRTNLRLSVPQFYRDRLVRMAQFTAAYSRPDGSVPLWGDADDARALPFGSQKITDHRYVVGLAGCTFAAELKTFFSGPREEIFWLLGKEAAESLPCQERAGHQPGSMAFPDGGFYVMRNEQDHVFIDCGPVGLAGRGGHGHNDALSFEAALDGIHLITDCGCYVYTADYAERNRFRSTASHNTPMIDGQEINRFVSPNNLWSLRNDARPEARRWEVTAGRDVFCGAHSGYRRLDSPVTPVRTIVLEKSTHALTIVDEFEGPSAARIEIPLHLAPGVTVRDSGCEGIQILSSAGREFELVWKPVANWQLFVEDARVSPSYGVALPAKALLWRRTTPDAPPLALTISPTQIGAA